VSEACRPVLRRPDELAGRPVWARDLYLRRVERGLSLQALARATGIDFTLLSRYENGHLRPGVLNARRLDEALS
jgi:transcriptional regulator with XRE-family HTH domain